VVAAINAIIAAGLSLFWKYFPGVKKWYDKQSGDVKGGINFGLITLAVVIQYLLSYFEVIPDSNTFFVQDIPAAILIWVSALAANQGVYLSFKDVGKKKSA
jgi:hypothetical protein